MRKILPVHLFFLVLLTVLPSALPAQSYQIHNQSFLPAEYYVGDTVRMSFTLRTDRTYNISPPETFPDSGWVKILSMDVVTGARETEVVISLIPYYPGTRTLPPLELGDLVVDDLKLYTSSMLNTESSREIAGIRPPLLIPGTRTVGAILFSILFSLPVVLIFLFRIIRNRTGEIIRSYRVNLPYRQFQRLVRRIRRSMVSMPEKEFYKRFSKGLKSYLSSRLNEDLTSSTTTEIEVLMSRTRVQESLVLALAGLFHRIDRVKFAGEKLLYSDREQLLSEVEQLSAALEEWRKTHADL
jgi:hypothetical protein